MSTLSLLIVSNINLTIRILLTCVRYLGNLPCPRCRVHKDQVVELGSVRDIKRWGDKRRVDDEYRQGHVEAARRLIYREGLSIHSNKVKNLLDPMSLTPTRVSANLVTFQCILC